MLTLSACRGSVGDDEPLRPEDPRAVSPCGPVVSPPLASTRLDPRKLAHALEDALGFRPSLEADFPAPDISASFSTSSDALGVDLDQVRTIADLADEVAVQAMDHFDALLPCVPSALDATCADRFIEELVAQMFRGTHTQDDILHMRELYRTLQQGEGALGPDLALAGVISAVIQSPGFLYLVEVGTETDTPTRQTLTEREIANRLAFLLTERAPDTALLERASAGGLHDPGVRRAEAERLLASPGASDAVLRFFREWVHVEGQDQSDRVGAEVAQALDEELARFVRDAVFNGGSVVDLVSSRRTWVNRALAEHYGFDVATPDDGSWVEVELPAEHGAGLLSRGAVAAATSSNGGTSIVRRGRFVREALLCQELPPPPPGATERQPVLPPNATQREKSEARAALGACASCHRRIDPIGLGMEDVDNAGRFRSIYGDGRPLDVAGDLSEVIGGGAFKGVAELGQLLAESETYAQCVPQQWYRFALGTSDGAACHVSNVSDRLRDTGWDLREVFLSVIESDSFITRRNSPSEQHP